MTRGVRQLDGLTSRPTLRSHGILCRMTRLGFLGAGTVGSAVIDLLGKRNDIPVSLGKALVRDLTKPRQVASYLLSTSADEVLASADILVELLGGTELAADLMLQHLQSGKPVVTANKAALAERWDDFLPYLEQGLLHFEAAVMAGTPVIGPLSGALRGSSPIELHAILNGTCNYILSELENGVPYSVALAEAQRLGYAEADPTLDVGGFDAAHKLTVLGRLVFDPQLSWEAVKTHTTGISHLTPKQMQGAIARGGRIRLLGSIYPHNGQWHACVRTVFLPGAHPMASAASNRNALYFRGDAVGSVFITGAGAGGQATASGVLADIIAALNKRPGPDALRAALPVAREAVEVLEEVR